MTGLSSGGRIDLSVSLPTSACVARTSAGENIGWSRQVLLVSAPRAHRVGFAAVQTAPPNDAGVSAAWNSRSGDLIRSLHGRFARSIAKPRQPLRPRGRQGPTYAYGAPRRSGDLPREAEVIASRPGIGGAMALVRQDEPREALGSAQVALKRLAARCQSAAPAILLLAALAAAAAFQGGFFLRGQIAAGALLAAAVIAALPFDRSARRDLGAPLVLGLLCVGWGVARAVPDGQLGSAASEAVLVAAVALVVVLCRGLDGAGRELVLAGLFGIGVVVALVGWAAVVTRTTPWATPSAGLWRAASTLTYANAMAAVLVPLVLTALALRTVRLRSLPLALVLTVLVLGVLITLSRAAALSLVIGLIVLVLLLGWIVLRALAVPMTGAGIAFIGLVPSLSTFPPARPGLAAAGLAAGVGAVALLIRLGGGRSLAAVAMLLGLVAVGGLIAVHGPANHLWHHRAHLSSPSRSNAANEALRLVERHPLAGVGLGTVDVQRRDASGRLRVQQYVHDEYLQVLLQQGVIGVMLLVALLAVLWRMLWRRRQATPHDVVTVGALAAVSAAAIQAGFDFVWHVPAVPLMLAALF